MEEIVAKSEVYTPTTDEVRNDYLRMGRRSEKAAEFDRWLAAHDRTVAAKAWTEGFGAGFHNLADISDHFRAGGSIETIRPPAQNPYAEQIGEDQ